MIFENKYKATYCEIAFELLSQGKSCNKVCAELMITKPTLKAWCDKFPDFGLAIELGKIASEAYWEELGHDGIIADGFSVAMYMIQMRNRFGWRATDEKKELDSIQLNLTDILELANQKRISAREQSNA